MSRQIKHLKQLGFLTIAQNNDSTDYLKLAYFQALTIKKAMPNSLYAVIVDEYTAKYLSEEHKKVFDFVILMGEDYCTDEQIKMANEWQVFNLSPFKETIKLESDLLITRDISHWIETFRLKDIILSLGCKNFKQETATSRFYRRIFDINELPDIYNGLMYFKYSKVAANFFYTAKSIFSNWGYISKNVLKNAATQTASTDLVYALAAKIIGVENCTLPEIDFINFVHMKPAINDWSHTPWHEQVYYELDPPMLRINNVNQYYPVHYFEKNWVTDDLIEEYKNECLG